MGTFVFSIGVESSVAVVIDDVSTVQAGQSLANLADIERVELLRGPQSTLFGKSASAGLINVTTMAPANEFASSVELMATANNSSSDSDVLGNLSVQYFLADDIMLYARYAQGYKGQAYNVVTGFNQEDADNPVAPETSDSYELGLKSTLWDQRLQFNATVLYTEYQDFQAQSFNISPETGFSAKLRNVGELETSGVELDGVALLGENLTLRFAATYLDTEIKSFDNAPCYTGQTEETGCVDRAQNLEGAPLPNAPEWKYNIAADYQLELASMPF